MIGNGFDLAHDLPTSYRDFLDFTKAYKKYKDVCMAGEGVKEEWEKSGELIFHIPKYDGENWLDKQPERSE